SRTHASTPFSLMFARAGNTFTDYSFTSAEPIPLEELQKRCDTMHDLVFPIVANKLNTYQERMRIKFDAKNKVKVDRFQVGAFVMTIPDERASKLEPRYEGPFKIIHKTRQGTFQLLDADGKALGRNYSPQQLKLISSDTFFGPTAVISKIVDHKTEKDSSKSYLVEWEDKNIPKQWVAYKDFIDTKIVTDYNDSLNPNSKKNKKIEKDKAAKRQRKEE
ncbi:hypothetical protein HDU99_001355, partial [Rhizoclosmatium hyalinum]